MFSRIAYAFRETWASFQRNLTLTAAAIVTAAVALLLAGTTLLIQRSFDNLLARWRGGVEMIVVMNPAATAEQIEAMNQTLGRQVGGLVESYRYLDKRQSYEEIQRLFAGRKTLAESITPEGAPAQFKIVPATSDATLVTELGSQLRDDPGVYDVAYAEQYFKIISRLSGFVRTVTTAMSVVLLVVAVGLIWNTIRTAMFARRREIEVMKLVGATNWFIRVPFMLEGLLQGLIGGVLSCIGLGSLNWAWTNAISDFNNDIAALQVPGGYLQTVMILILVVGMAAGAVGSGIAASRFLDV
jgi:cell division transport system permease protein